MSQIWMTKKMAAKHTTSGNQRIIIFGRKHPCTEHKTQPLHSTLQFIEFSKISSPFFKRSLWDGVVSVLNFYSFLWPWKRGEYFLLPIDFGPMWLILANFNVKKRDMSRSFLCAPVILLGSCAFALNLQKGMIQGAVDPRRISRHKSNSQPRTLCSWFYPMLAWPQALKKLKMRNKCS